MSIFIIAEAGVNHNGDYAAAVRLCDAAEAGGADAVKFQHFSSRKLWGDDRIEHLELCEAELINLFWHCKSIGIEFMATPFDAEAVEFLQMLSVKRMKIASGCLHRRDILDALDWKMPVILSTGMNGLPEVEAAIAALRNPLTLLQCTSIYPCPSEQVNLLAMNDLRRLGHPVGFSDHTATGVAAIAAAALGASVIEKHLTLDRSQGGPDHRSSVEPTTFALMVQSIREVEKMRGDGVKAVLDGERALREQWHDRG